MQNPPNFRRGECCYNCKNGKGYQSRCGEHKFYCTKFDDMIDDVLETDVCDDFDKED